MKRALSFLTIFGRGEAPNEETMTWFPLVGAMLGLVVGLLWWVSRQIWPAELAGAVVVSVDVVLSGFLHVDGLADAGDGLIAPMSRERRLEVMSDPRIGAFGVVLVVAVMLLRFGAFSATSAAPLMVAGLWCASRTSMVVITRYVPYARSSGLVSGFLTTSSASRVRRLIRSASLVAGYLGAGVLVVASRGSRGLAALLSELAAIVVVTLFARRRLGGYTGDVLGAAGLIGETIGLLVMVSR